jgi:hypothetical protein
VPAEGSGSVTTAGLLRPFHRRSAPRRSARPLGVRASMTICQFPVAMPWPAVTKPQRQVRRCVHSWPARNTPTCLQVFAHISPSFVGRTDARIEVEVDVIDHVHSHVDGVRSSRAPARRADGGRHVAWHHRVYRGRASGWIFCASMHSHGTLASHRGHLALLTVDHADIARSARHHHATHNRTDHHGLFIHVRRTTSVLAKPVDCAVIGGAD